MTLPSLSFLRCEEVCLPLESCELPSRKEGFSPEESNAQPYNNPSLLSVIKHGSYATASVTLDSH